MRILFATSECSPYASTGGLADVAKALPEALLAVGVDIVRVMPYYRHVAESDLEAEDTGMHFNIPLGTKTVQVDIMVSLGTSPKTYFVRRDEYFDRSELYSLPHRDYDDNFERFTLFQKAIVELIDTLKWKPDIVHCNDWQTALIPLFLEHGLRGHGRELSEKTLFTIHNLAYQGLSPASMFPLLNLPGICFSTNMLEFYGQINCMKGALLSVDAINTVSQSYAQEIQTISDGCGLEGVLQSVSGRLSGILNGVDYSSWNPANDKYLIKCYDFDSIANKASCRKDLGDVMGLELTPTRPIVAMVTRLAEQKGLDILAEAMPAIMELNLSFVLLGSGSEHYHNLCRKWALQWPDRFSVRLEYNPELAHKIEGGGDIFLMPSRFEPCGLNQLYSLRYGTIPVVHATGGLKDTIHDADANLTGNGFVFDDYSAAGLISCLRRALTAYSDQERWSTLIQRAMAEDFSWSHAAKSYLRTYEGLLQKSE